MVASVASSRSTASMVPDPSEVAGADRRQQIEADDWSARSGGRAPAPGLPGNCPAAACDRPASRRSRRTARSGARSAARRARRRPTPAAGLPTSGETGSPSARSPARRSRAPRTAAASGHVPCPESQATTSASDADDDRAGHPTIEAEEVEPGTDRRLRRRDPFEQMPAGDEQPDQGPPDRVAHQPRLMREKGDQQAPTGSARGGDRRRARARWLRGVIPARRGTMAPMTGMQGRQHDRREDEDGPDERGVERQRPARQQGERRPPAPTASAADCRASSSGRSPAWRRAPDPRRRRGPRPKIHGSNCQSPRAQRWWRSAATS